MFSYISIDYRAGIELTGKDGIIRRYSLDFFMREFVDYWQIKAAITSWMPNLHVVNSLQTQDATASIITLDHPKKFWKASQSLITGNTPFQDADLDNPNINFIFSINGRTITCPHNTNCYVIDRDLLREFPESFLNNEISYLSMGRFMLANGVNHEDLAKASIDIISGNSIQRDCPAIKVMPVFLAATLLSESRRNPSVFLPSLMLLELIAQSQDTSFGDKYHWGNCIQNTQLLMQHIPTPNDEEYPAITHSYFMNAFLYPRMSQMPTISAIQTNGEARKQLKAIFTNTKYTCALTFVEIIGQKSENFSTDSDDFSEAELQERLKLEPNHLIVIKWCDQTKKVILVRFYAQIPSGKMIFVEKKPRDIADIIEKLSPSKALKKDVSINRIKAILSTYYDFTMTEKQLTDFNGLRQYNQRENQFTLMQHEACAQAGGYFPASHRFSFSEIEPKRKAGISTLADKKCFIIICDFLIMLKLASPIHTNYIESTGNINIDISFLKAAVLPFLWQMQQSRYPSENLDRHQKYIPWASASVMFRDNLQRKITSSKGLDLYPEKKSFS